jgi:putative ABC transport system permease protein
MEIGSILSSMRRNKIGPTLIAIQMAVTLAVLCNALFIIEQRLALGARLTGVDEQDVFVIKNQWVGDPGDLASRVRTDVAALRVLPGALDAYVTNTFPLSNSGSTWPVALQPNQSEPSAMTAAYYADEHGLSTLGLRLIAGRNFNSDEVVDLYPGDRKPPGVVIITRALAERLFPQGNALGESIFVLSSSIRIIGIVGKLQVPWVSATGWGSTFNDNSALVPLRPIKPESYYVVRARPGELVALMKAAPKRLVEISRMRIIGNVYSLSEARVWVYHDDLGLARLLVVVCALLLTVTAFGILGLTSYWVVQRRRQIGVRRALGATRLAVVHYFQTENLLIAGSGAAVGVLLAIALNVWMISSFEMERLRYGYLVIGTVVVLLLGQIAALWPALRAASIPPAIAARGA